MVSPPPPDVAPASGRQVVAAIGIDRYRHWRGLSNAVGDALGVVALFRQLGFEEVAPPLLDDRATGKAIEALVTDELTGLAASDSLIVFFAGHGGSRTQCVGGRDVRTGYLIPVDAADDPRQVNSWIELDPWLRRISKLPPRHILVVLDACFSGIALSAAVKWGRDSGALIGLPFAAAHARQSRLVITSALDDERAMDDGPMPGHSLFTGCLLEALTGGLPSLGRSDGRDVTIGSELGRYVRNRVQTYPGRPGWKQTPDLGTFDFDDRGEMLIPVLANGVALPARLARGSGRSMERPCAAVDPAGLAGIDPGGTEPPLIEIEDDAIDAMALEVAALETAALEMMASRLRPVVIAAPDAAGSRTAGVTEAEIAAPDIAAAVVVEIEAHVEPEVDARGGNQDIEAHVEPEVDARVGDARVGDARVGGARIGGDAAVTVIDLAPRGSPGAALLASQPRRRARWRWYVVFLVCAAAGISAAIAMSATRSPAVTALPAPSAAMAVSRREDPVLVPPEAERLATTGSSRVPGPAGMAPPSPATPAASPPPPRAGSASPRTAAPSAKRSTATAPVGPVVKPAPASPANSPVPGAVKQPPPAPPRTPAAGPSATAAVPRPSPAAPRGAGVTPASPATASAASLCKTRIAAPHGAEVTWDRQVVTVPDDMALPCDVEVALGFHKSHYVDVTVRVTPTAGGRPVSAHLQKVMAKVEIHSTPEGATVTVGRRAAGTTPAVVSLAKFESATVTLAKDGYAPVTRRVNPSEVGSTLQVALTPLTEPLR